ncbi:MAG: DNA polymerase III subunit delta [Actinobacteria bacterium]|nr:MAG: DNA polymerase III subunit delta [Actinomycetota bacterium]
MSVSELKPAYLLSGTDRPKIARALRRLRDRVGDDATEQLSAREATGDDAVATCNAMGLFVGNGRLVIVDEVERWKADDVKAVASYLAAPAPATVLALVAGDLKADSALAKAVKKGGELLAYEVPKRRLPEWVAEQFARLGAKADRDACRALVEVVGDDLDELSSEIDKLATWAGGEPITVAAVEQLAVGRAETPIFSLTDAWGRRDVGAVLAMTESLLERTHRTRSGELLRIVASLVGHVGRVRRAQRLADEGVRARDAAGKLKMHPFAAEKAFAQAANFSADELSLALVRLAELDAAAKGGSRMPAELELDRTLVDVTRRAG